MKMNDAITFRDATELSVQKIHQSLILQTRFNIKMDATDAVHDWKFSRWRMNLTMLLAKYSITRNITLRKSKIWRLLFQLQTMPWSPSERSMTKCWMRDGCSLDEHLGQYEKKKKKKKKKRQAQITALRACSFKLGWLTRSFWHWPTIWCSAWLQDQPWCGCYPYYSSG